MQAMGTPITVTTPNPGEVTAIQPASGTPAAPFDAVLAQMAPDAGVAGAPVADAASAVAPVALSTGTAVSALSPMVEQALPYPSLPAVQPVFSTMVNAADPAEADIAALMAATAVATRGVAARPPEPVSSPALPASPEVVVPDDFIGPVRPPELTADPAALVAVNAAGLPEAAEFAAASMAAAPVAPADFIGPQLPAERRMAAMAAEQPSLAADARTIDDIVSQPAPLPEAQALLQPKHEETETEQPEAAMVPPPMMTADNGHAPVQADGFVLAATLSASATIADSAPSSSVMNAAVAKTIARTTGTTAHQQHDMSGRTPDPARDELTIAMVAASQDAFHAHDHDSQTESHSDVDRAAIEADLSEDRALAALMQQAAMVAPQAVSQHVAPAHTDEPQTVSLPQTAQPVAIDPRIGPQALTRDEALLRVMNEIAPAKPQSQTKNDRAVQPKATAMGALSTAIASGDALELTARASNETVRVETDATGALRHALARASADRDEARHLADARSTEHGLDTKAERTTIDPKVAAMVRSVTVTHGAADNASDVLTTTTIVAPSPVVTPSAESIARDASGVAAVNAEGRRDTKRDAEIRQRQIEQQINIALRSGMPEIRMQLYPPGLGQVIIRLALDGQKLRLAMVSDNEDASASLAQTESGLRDALSRDGYTLAGFDVHDNGEQNRRHQSRADAATQPTTSPAEGDAFSVDMTA